MLKRRAGCASPLKALRQFWRGRGLLMAVGHYPGAASSRGFTPTSKAMAILARLKERNAETIFGAVAVEIEGIGVRVVDARCFIGRRSRDPGLMTGGRLRVEPETLEHGLKVCKEWLSRYGPRDRGRAWHGLGGGGVDVFARLPIGFPRLFAKSGTESRALANPFQPLPGLPFAGANVDLDVGRLGLANDVFQRPGATVVEEDRDFIQIQHQRPLAAVSSSCSRAIALATPKIIGPLKWSSRTSPSARTESSFSSALTGSSSSWLSMARTPVCCCNRARRSMVRMLATKTPTPTHDEITRRSAPSPHPCAMAELRETRGRV